MKQVQIVCDRCKKTIDGIIADVPATGIPNRYTGGFYDLTGGYWGKFARPGEKNICDECMHGDPEYKKLYNPGAMT